MAKGKKIMSMNLFEIHEYIESVENRVATLEKLIIQDQKKERFENKPPFYYDHYKKAKRENG
jgi:23S rRNA maturation-related 3'-5' exoribonuclease YhaM